MNSVSAECQELKDVYDACFLSWFSEKFLKGSTEDTCAPLFVQYQKCVKKAIKDLEIDI
ncbi:Mitochondrial distribution/morphology family 35/apoptosis, partial [Trinorchestia longiramus]